MQLTEEGKAGYQQTMTGFKHTRSVHHKPQEFSNNTKHRQEALIGDLMYTNQLYCL